MPTVAGFREMELLAFGGQSTWNCDISCRRVAEDSGGDLRNSGLADCILRAQPS
jgi:hypothetical protein